MKQNMVKRIMSGVLAAAMVFSSLTVSTATTAKAAAQITLQEDTEYIIVSKNSNKAITVKDNSKSDNAKIVQMPVTESASQIWTLDSDGKGYYQLINKNSGKALDVPNSSKEEGKAIIQWSKGSGDNQKWKISHEGSGYYRITPKLSSKFGLNVSGNSTKDGAEIIQWNYGNGSDNSKWEIREVKKQSSNLESGVLRLEAEDGVSGGNVIYDSKASGGKLVGDISEIDNQYNTSPAFWFEIKANKTDYYPIRIYYASDENRELAITTIPNGYKYDLAHADCPSTGGWTTVGDKPAETRVYLQEGTNLLRFGGNNGWGPNVDYIEILGLNQTTTDAVRYEAENADCGINTSVMNDSKASGGKLVGNVGGLSNSDDILRFTVDCQVAGDYEVRVGYASGEDRDLAVAYVPDDYKVRTSTISCKSTGGWTNVGVDSTTIYLHEGSNDITIAGVNSWGPNIDYIEIVGLTTSVLRLEAEDGAVDGVMDVSGASGGKMVGDIEDIVSPYEGRVSFHYTIKCEKTGNYTVRVYYASGEKRRLAALTIPNNYKYSYTEVGCPSTGGWETVGEPVEMKVYLEEGTNALGFGGVDGWGPNVDYIEILGL